MENVCPVSNLSLWTYNNDFKLKATCQDVKDPIFVVENRPYAFIYFFKKILDNSANLEKKITGDEFISYYLNWKEYEIHFRELTITDENGNVLSIQKGDDFDKIMQRVLNQKEAELKKEHPTVIKTVSEVVKTKKRRRRSIK
jgi:hypothetical protein